MEAVRLFYDTCKSCFAAAKLPENQKIQQEKETVARTMEQLRAKEHKQETEKPSLFKRIWYALFGNKHEE